ncbi:MGDG synthase family glycosyltransferase [Alkalicoccobacillus plakortidis]|uniref:UDP-N-acetylglucosamine:LPS N-acetylglucosamine transferase n=1 Tax=Alkalicoccobacillus plakortidis TaxID=444060 RepID=A0ABT0XGM6_9BACI|nr:glycosyltransferase [Alkalicoccobacillus plakortidis]MCM2675066.1 hypothetical protein [Alkalicoccobacillus plakortidis]
MHTEPLILHVSIGYGHTKTATILSNELKKQTNFQPQILDLFSLLPRWQSEFIRTSYYKLIKNAPSIWGTLYHNTAKSETTYVTHDLLATVFYSKLALILADPEIPFIISTHTYVTRIIAIWKQKLGIHTPLYHICTDFGFHQLAIHSEVTGYFLSGLATLPPSLEQDKSVYSYGIPVEKDQDQVISKSVRRSMFGFTEDEQIVMIAGGGEGIAPYESILESLQVLSNLTILCMTGTNEQVHPYNHASKQGHSIHFISFTEHFSNYVHLSDVLITKAGGQTLAHALTTDTPVVLYQPIQGQEVENAQLLKDKKAAIYARNSHQLLDAVYTFLNNPAARLVYLQQAQSISKPNATQKIIHQITHQHQAYDLEEPFFHVGVKSIAEY